MTTAAGVHEGQHKEGEKRMAKLTATSENEAIGTRGEKEERDRLAMEE